MDMKHLDYLHIVADIDIDEIKQKEMTYEGSWKKRGGVGAAMMMLRKIDRLEVILKENSYDIFQAINKDISGQDGTALAEVRDLRRYLLLIESEIYSNREDLFRLKPEEYRPGTPEDGGHHARQQED